LVAGGREVERREKIKREEEKARVVRAEARSVGFFFFKQKTAYEIHERLVGSEMCIRGRAQLIGAKFRRPQCRGGEAPSRGAAQ
ncbi:hypothetical protein, partial [Actinotignum timonense]|uniref:hypothetical protein n=1 Tax=Actinotignum timonense TaxID=1870995 RepID=UPI002A8963E0|nr:hypothetical protein [Actinotignum timonense]